MRSVTITYVDDTHRMAAMSVNFAETEEERRKGLGGRSAANPPMLFQEEFETNLHYTMQPMLIPIDIAFIDARGFIAKAVTAQPGAEVFYEGRPVQWVLEMPQGAAKHIARLLAILQPNAPPLARFL